MADTLFIRLAADGAASWAAFDSLGRLLGSLGHGPLASARAAAAGRRVTALAPAVDVLRAQAELPAASPARLRQIVPFSLEESLADDVEQLAFAVGTRGASGTTPVAVATRERMNEWLDEFRRAGFAPHALCSEADGVPSVPATLVLMVEGERIYGRCHDEPPFAVEGFSVPAVVAMARGHAEAEPAFTHVRVYTDHAHGAEVQAELAEVEGNVELKVLADGVFAQLAATLAQRPGVSLLQGAYAPKSNWAALARPWRFAASLAVALGVLVLVLQGAQYWQLKRADDTLAELVTSTCQQVVGDSRLSACQRAVQQRLAATGQSTSSEDFLTTLAAVAAARKEAMRIDGLSYRNRAMDLQLVVGSVPELDEFARALEQTQRFSVSIEGTANQTDAGLTGRLHITGGSP